MTTQTHTPGPWTYTGTGGHVGGPDRIRVADCYNLERSIDERQANARLIAAAPDLLAALVSLFAECAMTHKHWGENSNNKQADAAIASAHAAILKARGTE